MYNAQNGLLVDKSRRMATSTIVSESPHQEACVPLDQDSKLPPLHLFQQKSKQMTGI